MGRYRLPPTGGLGERREQVSVEPRPKNVIVILSRSPLSKLSPFVLKSGVQFYSVQKVGIPVPLAPVVNYTPTAIYVV